MGRVGAIVLPPESSPGRSGDIDAYGTWLDEVGRLVDFARNEQPGVCPSISSGTASARTWRWAR